MRIVLTMARAAPATSDALYLDLALHEVSRCGIRLRLSRQIFLTAAGIVCSPSPLSPTALAEHLYNDRLSGGPDYALSTVRVLVFHARRALLPFGVVIHTGAFGWWADDAWQMRRAA